MRTMRLTIVVTMMMMVLAVVVVGADRIPVRGAEHHHNNHHHKQQHDEHHRVKLQGGASSLPVTTLPIAFQSDEVNITASDSVYLKAGNAVRLGDEFTPLVAVDYNTQFVPPFTKGDGSIRGLKCPLEGAVRHNVPNDGVNPPELCYCVAESNGALMYYCVALSKTQ